MAATGDTRALVGVDTCCTPEFRVSLDPNSAISAPPPIAVKAPSASSTPPSTISTTRLVMDCPAHRSLRNAAGDSPSLCLPCRLPESVAETRPIRRPVTGGSACLLAGEGATRWSMRPGAGSVGWPELALLIFDGHRGAPFIARRSHRHRARQLTLAAGAGAQAADAGARSSGPGAGTPAPPWSSRNGG